MAYTLTNHVPLRVTDAEFRQAYNTAIGMCTSAVFILSRYLAGRANSRQSNCVVTAFQEAERGSAYDITAHPNIASRILQNYQTIKNTVLPTARFEITNDAGVWGISPNCINGPTPILSGVLIRVGEGWISSGSDACTYASRLRRHVSRGQARIALRATTLIHESMHYIVGLGHGRHANHNPYFYEFFVLNIRFGEGFADMETELETGAQA